MARRILLPLFALLAAAAHGEPPRKRVVLALAGGGAYGLMDLGALEWLERHRVPVDAIAGTSGGALVGGWYATGLELLSDDEIRHPVEPRAARDLRLRGAAPILRTIDYEHLFDSGPAYRNLSMPQKRERRQYPNDLFTGLSETKTLRRDGLVPGQAVGFLLDWIGRDYGVSFDELPTPFRAVAVDAVDADPARWRTVVLGGPRPEIPLGLSRAVRASIAVPLLFAPVDVDGHRLIDGAVRDNLPTDAAIDAFDPDVLIGLRWDNGSGADPFRAGAKGRTPRETALITFDPRPYRVDQFSKWREFAWIGYRGMEAHRAELERYALTPEAYLAYRQTRRARRFDHRVARVEGGEGELEGVRRAVVGRNLDDMATTRALGQALDRLVADRGLATAGYDLRPGGALVVRTTRHRAGPPALRGGLEARVESGERTALGVRARLSDLREGTRRYWLDGTLGTDPAFRAGLEVPLAPRLSAGSMLRLDRQVEAGFEGDRRRSQVAVSTTEARVGLFYRPQRDAELALGAFVGDHTASDRSGATFDAGSGGYRGLLMRAERDALDDPVVPRRGGRAWIEGRAYDGPFSQVEGRVEGHFGPLHDAWGAEAAFGTSLGAHVPFPFEFRPGSPPYREDEIRGDAFASFALTETHALAPLPFALGRLFLVGRLGNAWAEGRSYPGATLSLLGDTRAGALSLGLGVAERGTVRLLFGLGRRF